MIDILYSVLYLVPLTLLSVFGLYSKLGYTEEAMKPLTMVFIILPIVILLTALKSVDGKKRAIILGSMLALISGIILVIGDEGRRKLFLESEGIWWVLGIAVAVMVIAGIMVRYRKIKLTAVFLLLGVLIASYWLKLIDDKVSLVSVIFLIMNAVLEEVRLRERGDQIRYYAIGIAPFVAFAMVVLMIFPNKDTPYEWPIINRVVNGISDRVSVFVQSLEPGDSTNDLEASFGFSENASIFGNVSGDPEEMMSISVGVGAPEVFYLDGKYFEDFDGRKWSEAEKTYPYMMDSLEACCTTSMIDLDYVYNYRKIEEAVITYNEQNTRYVFAPVKSLVSAYQNKNMPISYSGNEILFDKKRGKTTSYVMKYVVLNRNKDMLPVLMELGEQIDAGAWEAECRKHGVPLDEYSYDAFLRYREMLYDNSLCPNAVSRDELSSGVLRFLDRVNEGKSTNYSKLSALEHAFSDFDYTTSPGALPSYVDSPADFLDYFINKSRKGYCNSFATAFVLLCQAEGIPARFVNGYRIPRNNKEEVAVLNTMAHAYAEAYVEGLGWMVFDPTPGFGINLIWDEKGEYMAPYHSGSLYESDEESDDLEDWDEENNGSRIRWYMIVVPVVLSMLALTVIVIILRLINNRYFRRLNKEDKARLIALRIMAILRRQGFVKADYETVREYATRALREREISLKGFAEAYEKILYSPKSFTENDYNLLYQDYLTITVNLRGRDKIYHLLSFWGF